MSMAFSFVPQSRIIRNRASQLTKAQSKEVKSILKQYDAAELRIARAFMTFVRSMGLRDVMDQFEIFYDRGSVTNIEELITGPLREFVAVFPKVFRTVGDETNLELRDLFDVRVAKVDVAPGVGISFDPGDQAAARLMREYQLDLIREIGDAQRDVIRQSMTRALSEGMGAAEASRLFRGSIGLTDFQMRAVGNFESLLRQGNPDALTRVLRDKRFDSTIRRAIDRAQKLTETQIKTMTDRYRERMVAARAETIARTEGLRTVNVARQEALEEMTSRLGFEEQRIERVWRSISDGRTRHTHRAMNNQKKGIRERFVSPSGAKLMYPGDRTAPAAEVINCRCTLLTNIKSPEEVSKPVAREFTHDQNIFRASWSNTYEDLSYLRTGNYGTAAEVSEVPFFTRHADTFSGDAKVAFDALQSDIDDLITAYDQGIRDAALEALDKAVKNSYALQNAVVGNERLRLVSNLATQDIYVAAKKHIPGWVKVPLTPGIYVGSPTHDFKIIKENDATIAAIAKRTKTTEAAVREKLQKKAETLVGKADVYVRLPEDPIVMDKVLASGRLKTQFESGSSRGVFDPTFRVKGEQVVLGIPENAPVSQRPIYGYMTQNKDGMSWLGTVSNGRDAALGYGRVAFKIKASKRPFMTVTGDDSLSRAFKPSPVTAPDYNSFDALFLNKAKSVQTATARYTEVQIGGGVSIADDVEEVIFYAVRQEPARMQQLYEKYKDTFERMGIKVRLVMV